MTKITRAMPDNLDISNYLTEVYDDWQSSRDEFPNNTYPRDQWPIPFFGNPTKAIVATVGVNPSSITRPADLGLSAKMSSFSNRRLAFFTRPGINAHIEGGEWKEKIIGTDLRQDDA